MCHRLIRHPLSSVSAVDDIFVQAQWQGEGQLWLRYHVECDVEGLVWPVADDAIRADDLWKSTCLELFLKEPEGSNYFEFNFAPSRQWAAYHFSGYRENMRAFPLADAPEIWIDRSDSHFALEATLGLPGEWSDHPLLMGLSAVIDEKQAAHSYWALAHPPGKPDFHHGHCFAVQLAAASSA